VQINQNIMEDQISFHLVNGSKEKEEWGMDDCRRVMKFDHE